MLKFISGDMFDEKHNYDAIACTVNCVGVMGAGIALKTRKLYPTACLDYFMACKKGSLKPGGLIVSEQSWDAAGPRYIFHVATKNHYKNPSRIEWIASGVVLIKEAIESRPAIRSIAIPSLGCGLGGLSWSHVRPIIETCLQDLNVNTFVYEPR